MRKTVLLMCAALTASCAACAAEDTFYLCPQGKVCVDETTNTPDSGDDSAVPSIDAALDAVVDSYVEPDLEDAGEALDSATPLDAEEPDAALPHGLFVGDWVCVDTQTTDILGKPLDEPKVGSSKIFTITSEFLASDFLINTTSTAVGHVEDGVFVASSDKSVYRLQLADPYRLEGSWTNVRYPKMQVALVCTR